jgi:argininosuccinate lyase
MVAESSAMLTAMLGNTLNQLITARSNNDNIDGKLSEFKKDLLKELDAREKQAEQKLSDKLEEKFSDLIRVLRGSDVCFKYLIYILIYMLMLAFGH